MLVNFFRLNLVNPPIRPISSQADFETGLSFGTGFRNQIYDPLTLKSSDSSFHQIKITGYTFSNFSFSKTLIEDVMFNDCIFEDCLFIGTELRDCEFHNCIFKNVNTHKIIIENCYVNPSSFNEAVIGYKFANIGVHLFHQLLQNSKDQSQRSFARLAEYQFKKWENRLLVSKYKSRGPHRITLARFLPKFLLNCLKDLVFGYGLRFRNFAITFSIVFIGFWILNYQKWNAFAFHKKDLSIESFNPDSANIVSSGLYTLDVTTKLVDSQFQPTSTVGMYYYAAESICAFILLSALVTLILNRFVK